MTAIRIDNDTLNTYSEFLKSKAIRPMACGFTPSRRMLDLFPWQWAIVERACRIGRFAIFADCGLGKTPMQLEWAAQVLHRHGGRVLILAPLAVAEQTRREGGKFGVKVTVCRDGSDLREGINITNYEMLPHFRPEGLNAIVLDESSILKNYSGKVRQEITDFAKTIPYRLCCTATPAPNDLMEIGTHAEFLGVMRRVEMLATYFIHDSGETQKWRLKHHATATFYRWMTTWCMALRSPADIGFPDDYRLPSLHMHQTVVDSGPLPGRLFQIDAVTLSERREARSGSLEQRVQAVADLVNADTQPWIVWCDLNTESELLAKSIPDAVEIRGSHSPDHKKTALEGFATGAIRVLVTKPSIAGFGLNWQRCAAMAFTGLSDSYEQFYQAVRRCWRFGQKYPVNVHIVISRSEGEVIKNIRRKEALADALYGELIANMRTAMEEKHVVCA